MKLRYIMWILLGMVGCKATFNGESFSVTHPKNITTERQSPIEDFNLYFFKQDEQWVLTIYEGNHPSYPKPMTKSYESLLENTPCTIHGYPLIYTNVTKNHSSENHVLLYRAEQMWPAYLHFIYPAETQNDVSLAQSIISSLRITPPAERE